MPATAQRFGADRYDELIRLLEGNDLVADFTGPELRTLAAYLLARAAEPDEILFREGEPGDSLYLLAEGEIKMFKEGEAQDACVVATESRLRSVGEMALLDGEPRSATCVATRASRLLVLKREAFERLCAERPGLALKLVQRLARLVSRRLRMTSGRLVERLEA